MKSLFLIFCLCCSTVNAEGVFAKASFPDSLLKEVSQPGPQYSAWIDEVELHTLPASELDKLRERFAAQKTKPEVVRYMPPMYPFEQKKAWKGGSVMVYGIVLKDGSVGDLYVGDYTHPDFAKAAALALKFWRFKPVAEESLFGILIPFKISKS